MTSNYSTIVTDTTDNIPKLRYVSQAHHFQLWNSNLINSSNAVSNVLNTSNYYSVLSIVNSNVGIRTTNPSYPLDISGDVRISGNLYMSSGAVGGTGQSFSYFMSSNLVATTSITLVSQNLNGKFNIVCAAVANVATFSWSLATASGTTLATGTGGTPYTFTDVTLPTGTNSIAVTATSAAGSSATSSTYTFTVEGTGPPLMNATLSFPSITTLAIDSVNYYTTTTTYSIAAGAASFSNMVGVSSYNGTNFLSIGTNNYNWSDIFNINPTTTAQKTSDKAIAAQTLSTCNLIMTLRNASQSNSYTCNIMWVPSLPTLVIPNTNPTVASISRAYMSGASLSTTDVLWRPLQNSFVANVSNVTSGYLFPASQSLTNIGTRRQLKFTLTNNGLLSAFSINHGMLASDISDITVAWTDIIGTAFSANTSYLNGGCGMGTQTNYIWYVQRPITISQTASSSCTVIITYGSLVSTMPIPSIG